MALTELQKAQNKAAQQVRDRAHNARKMQYSQAMEAVAMSEPVQALKRAAEAVVVECENANQAAEKEEANLRRQIAELEKRIAELHQDPKRAELHNRRRAAWNAWKSEKRNEEQKVEQRFPDLQGAARLSASAWTPPADVLAAMEKARSKASESNAPTKKPRS